MPLPYIDDFELVNSFKRILTNDDYSDINPFASQLVTLCVYNCKGRRKFVFILSRNRFFWCANLMVFLKPAILVPYEKGGKTFSKADLFAKVVEIINIGNYSHEILTLNFDKEDIFYYNTSKISFICLCYLCD